MQKISSYLYSNKVDINLDLASSPMEWRIVYQRNVKIYKGYSNTIELDIKNAQQKRFDVSALTMKCLIMDDLNQEVYTANVVHSGSVGLATFTIPASAVVNLTPQFLKYTVYVLNQDTTRRIVYGDTQFGATGHMELIGNAAVIVPAPEVIKTFTYLENTTEPIRTYYSESVIVNPKNDNDTTPTIELEFLSLGLAAAVKVQVTYDKVITTANTWVTVETFNLASTTSTLTKTYVAPTNFTNEVNWLRITYVRATDNTGKFDRINVRM
jgi:aspartate 1-decarboxylase